METIEEALQRVKGIHGDGYYYLAIEGECPDLRELEPYQRVCSLGIEGYYCLLEDKAKDAEDNLGVILENKHELESTSSDWQTTNGEPLESMFGLLTEEENKIIDSIAERIKKEQSKHSHLNWQKLAASKIYISLKEKIGVNLIDKFFNEFYLRRNNDFNNETKQMTIDESKNYWIEQNIN